MTIFEPVLLAVRQGNKPLAITEYMALSKCAEEEAERVITIAIRNYKKEQKESQQKHIEQRRQHERRTYSSRNSAFS